MPITPLELWTKEETWRNHKLILKSKALSSSSKKNQNINDKSYCFIICICSVVEQDKTISPQGSELIAKHDMIQQKCIPRSK